MLYFGITYGILVFGIIFVGAVTIISQDGKPVQVSLSALHAAGAQNTTGTYLNKNNISNPKNWQ